MKLSKLGILVCAGALLAGACNNSTGTNQTANTNPQSTPATSTSPQAAAPPTDQLAAARDTFGHTCARCHGDKGEGGEFDLEGKKLKAPSLRTGHALKHPEAQLAKQISEGGEGMPPFKKRLTPEQIDALVRFIRQDLQGGASANGAGSNDNHAAHSK
jgi:mono/diheme cytochrome c family protein